MPHWAGVGDWMLVRRNIEGLEGQWPHAAANT
jgi:hypothetical protein